MIDLRLGDWREVLADVEAVDAVITDPPYSARTAAGFRGLSAAGTKRGGIEYGSIGEPEIAEAVRSWTVRTRSWFVVFGDHITAPVWAKHLEAVGWYTFAPVPWVKRDAAPRFAGDGPSSSCEWITIARPKRRPKRPGARPGYYLGGQHRGDSIRTGQKPLYLMRAIVRDYTGPHDLIADPFAGSATTLIAAAEEGRYSVGAEVDDNTHALSARRIKQGFQPSLFVRQ